MEWPGQEENQSYQHFLHLSQEIGPPHSEQQQSGGGLAVTWNLSVSPGWIQKSTSGVVGMPFTPKVCQAHLSLQAVLYSPFPVLPGTPSPCPSLWPPGPSHLLNLPCLSGSPAWGHPRCPAAEGSISGLGKPRLGDAADLVVVATSFPWAPPPPSFPCSASFNSHTSPVIHLFLSWAALHSLWNLSPPTRDRTRAPCSGRAES